MMDFSDILAIIEILVTILFGYLITHWVSVRDSRTRSVKDIYLKQLDDIKGRVDEFFDKLLSDKLKGRSIADWYGHQQNSLTCFDDGLRLALPIRKEKLEDIVNNIHEVITGSEYYNEHFRNNRYVLTNDERVKMIDLKNSVDKAFNEYIVQINNSRQYYFWENLKRNLIFDKVYFTSQKKKCPWGRTLVLRLLRILPWVIIVWVLSIGFKRVTESYSNNSSKGQETLELFESNINRLFEETTSINETLKSISVSIEKQVRVDSSSVSVLKKQMDINKQLIYQLK